MLMAVDVVPWQLHYLALGAVRLGVAALVPVVLARRLEGAGRRLYLVLAALLLAPALYYVVGRPWEIAAARTATSYRLYPGFWDPGAEMLMPLAAGAVLAAGYVGAYWLLYRPLQSVHTRVPRSWPCPVHRDRVAALASCVGGVGRSPTVPPTSAAPMGAVHRRGRSAYRHLVCRCVALGACGVLRLTPRCTLGERRRCVMRPRDVSPLLSCYSSM